MTGNGDSLPELPRGWVWTRVGDIYDIVGGGTPSTKVERYWDGDIPWITSADIHGIRDIRPRRRITEEGIENSATNLVPAGSIIVVTRVGLGKLALANQPLCFNQDSQALVGNNHLIFPDYSLHYLSQAVQVFKYRHRGTTIAGVTKKQLSDLPFALPPLAEQRRMVAKIEELLGQLDAGVVALERAKAQLRRYRQAVLKAAVEGELTKTWREAHRGELEPASVLLEHILEEHRARWKAEHPGKRYEPPTSPDPDDLSRELTVGWVWATYDQIGEWSGGGTPSKRVPSYWHNGTVPWITPKDMKSPKLSDSVDKITRFGLDNSTAKLIPSGSILFVVRSGILRRTLPIALSLVDAAVNQDIKALTPFGYLDEEYLLITAQALSEDIRHSCAKDGTTVESIEVPTLRTYPIPLAPLAEQRRIVEEVEQRLSVTDEIGRAVEQSLKRAERLRESILSKAFEGKLLLQQSSDEPASVLVERIKAERARREAEKPRRRTEKKTRTRNRKNTKPQQLELI